MYVLYGLLHVLHDPVLSTLWSVACTHLSASMSCYMYSVMCCMYSPFSLDVLAALLLDGLWAAGAGWAAPLSLLRFCFLLALVLLINRCDLKYCPTNWQTKNTGQQFCQWLVTIGDKLTYRNADRNSRTYEGISGGPDLGFSSMYNRYSGRRMCFF